MRRSALFLLAALACGPASSPPPPDVPANVVVIVLDTVRGSAVSPTATPVLEQLAARGVAFDHAYATHDETPASHASIFTGLRDAQNGPLDHPANTVQHTLGALGYDTLAVIANGNVSPKVLRTAGGFATLRNLYDEYQVQPPADSDALIARAHARFGVPDTDFVRAMLATDAEHVRAAVSAALPATRRPLFLFVNLIDAHDPYTPPEPYTDTPPPGFFPGVRFRPLPAEYRDPSLWPEKRRREFERLSVAVWGGVWRIAWDLPPSHLAVYERRYLAEVSALDAALGRLLDTLRSAGVLDHSLLFVTADHGECFGERGLVTHSFSDLGDPECVLHVPLVIVREGADARPLRVDEPVSIADLAPTIYAAVGVDDTAMRGRPGYGRSLAPLLGDGFVARRTSHAITPVERPRSQGDEIDAEHRERLRALGYAE
jgi:arylsulfatase A-like enzyme